GRSSRASSRRLGRSCQMRSRPSRWLCTSPAAASAWRCLVTACRVIRVPLVSLVIERGPASPSRVTMRSRVASPSAAKTGASSSSLTARDRDITSSHRGGVGHLTEILVDELRLNPPALRVGIEGFGAAVERNLIEARLRDRQHRAPRSLFELEDNECRRLLRVVDVRIDRIGMPSIGEQPLWLDTVAEEIERLT